MKNQILGEIKKQLRSIELFYDYNHQKEDYDIFVNLSEAAELVATIREKAIDDMMAELQEVIDEHGTQYALMHTKERAKKLKLQEPELEEPER